MESLYIEATEFTPRISFNPHNQPFEIVGVSRPENASEFYEPIVKWLDNYSNNPLKETTINFIFDYFNTSSLKYFLIMLSKFKEIAEKGNNVIINWYYNEEDDSMYEAGKNLEELSELQFNFIPVS